MSGDLAYIGSIGTIRRTLDDCFENIVANKHYKKINTTCNGDLCDYITELTKLYSWFKLQLDNDNHECCEHKNYASMVDTLLCDGTTYKKPDVSTSEKALNMLKDLNIKLERDLIYGGFVQLMEDGIDVYNECKRIKKESISKGGIFASVLEQIMKYFAYNFKKETDIPLKEADLIETSQMLFYFAQLVKIYGVKESPKINIAGKSTKDDIEVLTIDDIKTYVGNQQGTSGTDWNDTSKSTWNNKIKECIDAINYIGNVFNADEQSYCKYSNAFTSSTDVQDDGLVYELQQRWADITNLLCGLKHQEDHNLAGKFGAESMELTRIINEAIASDFHIDGGATDAKTIDPHEKYNGFYEGLITQLTRLIIVYINSGLFEITDDNIAVKSDFSNYKKNGYSLKRFKQYKETGDIQTDLITKYKQRLERYNHVINDLKTIMENVEKIQSGEKEKRRNYKSEIYNILESAINKLNLTDVNQKLILYKNDYIKNITEFTEPLFKSIFAQGLLDKYNFKQLSKTSIDDNAEDGITAINLLIIFNSVIALHILDNKYNPTIDVNIELAQAKDLTNQKIAFEPTFASPMFAAIEHEMKIISYALDQNLYDILMDPESSFKTFIHELKKLIDTQYKGVDDIETLDYNNLTLGETFKLANTIVQHTLLALNAGEYYLVDNNKFNILCSAVYRISVILDYYHNGGKLFINELIKDNWDGDKLQLLSDGTYKTWLHQDLKKILVNVLSLENYNYVIKRGLLFTIIYINHWLRGDFNVNTFPGFNIYNANYDETLKTHLKYDERLNTTSEADIKSIITEFFDDPTEHGIVMTAKINKNENQRDYPIDFVKFSSGSQFGSFVSLTNEPDKTKNNSGITKPENIKRKHIVLHDVDLNTDVYDLEADKSVESGSKDMVLYNENDHYAGLAINYNKEKVNVNILVPDSETLNELGWFE